MNILLLQFNNYFNRIIKKYSTVEDYILHASFSAYANKTDTNFNPSDGIKTNHLINWSKEWNPDYLVVINDENEIEGRWFIIEADRTRGQQYRLSLKRDVVAEKIGVIANSPCFVEKGHVLSDNPLIFNRENFDCNQIKQQECLLKDKSQISWLVVYYNLDNTSKSKLQGSVSTTDQDYIDTGATTLAEWTFYSDYHEGYKSPNFKDLYVYAECAGTTDEARVAYDNNLNVLVKGEVQSDTGLSYNKGVSETLVAIQECIDSNKNTIKTMLGLYREPSMTLQNFLDHDGQLYKVGSTFYRVHITSNADDTIDEYLEEGDLFDALSNAFKVGGTFKAGWSGNFDEAFRVRIGFKNYSVDFVPETSGIHTYNFDFHECKDIDDAPYGMLVFPYKSNNTNPKEVQYGDWNLSLMIARQLCLSGVGPSSPIIDVQILPYCPLNLGATVYADGSISLNYLTELTNDDYTFVTEGLLNKLIVLHPQKCNFTKKIITTSLTISAQMYFSYKEGKGKDYKTENQCTFYRLVSPNYNGQFEFNRAKNGDFSEMNVDCTYKPYQPYIHVNPNFGRLYGKDYNDARGLICGGDFSITVATSAWETYKLQNKNFQEIFNRQIESMDTMHKYGMIEQGINAIAGTTQGAMSGFIMSGGNPIGAVAGAGLSGGGGIADLFMSQAKFNEQRDLAVDMHNFQLGNVKALPHSLSKVDGWNENNKLFPFLERYSCTDEEIEIFREKIKYEGMTINALGKIKDYIDTTEDMTFVKGQLIRLEGLNEESHFTYEIYNEISKGVYLYEYSGFSE